MPGNFRGQKSLLEEARSRGLIYESMIRANDQRLAFTSSILYVKMSTRKDSE